MSHKAPRPSFITTFPGFHRMTTVRTTLLPFRNFLFFLFCFFLLNFYRAAKYTGGVCSPGWSNGCEYGTAELYPSPDAPPSCSAASWAPHAYVHSWTPSPPRSADAWRTAPPWNANVSAKPLGPSHGRPDNEWRSHGHSRSVA